MNPKSVRKIVTAIQVKSRVKAPRPNPASAMTLDKGITGADLGNKKHR